MKDSTHILSITALAATLTAATSDYSLNTEDYTATAQYIGFTKSPIQTTSSSYYYGNSTSTSGVSNDYYPTSSIYANTSNQSHSSKYLSTDLGIVYNNSTSSGTGFSTNSLYATSTSNGTTVRSVTLQQSDASTSTTMALTTSSLSKSLLNSSTSAETSSNLFSNMETASVSSSHHTSLESSVPLKETTSTSKSELSSATQSKVSQSKSTGSTSITSTSTSSSSSKLSSSTTSSSLDHSTNSEPISTSLSSSASTSSSSSKLSSTTTSISSQYSTSTEPKTTSLSSSSSTISSSSKLSSSTRSSSTSQTKTTSSSTTTSSDAANYGSTSPVDPLSVNPEIEAYQEIGNIGYLLDKDDSALLLKLHNDVRSLHEDTPDLVWNNTLVAQSYEYMQYLINEDPSYSPCSGNLIHSGGRFGSNVGENLAAASGIDDLTTLFDLWSSEGQYYDYDNPSLYGGADDTTELGHFTQLVWKSTTAVGCGVQVCTDNDWTYLICRYYTEGNILYSGDTWKLFKENVLPLSS